MERRDDRRRADIRILQRHLQWRADAAGGQLPEGLAPTADCAVPELRLDDPGTGAPDRHMERDAPHCDICAEFDQPDLAPLYGDSPGFDPATGCVRATLTN